MSYSIPATFANIIRGAQDTVAVDVLFDSLIGYINESSPVGIVNALYGSSIPDGWLLCNGSTFSGTLYPDLQLFLGGTTLPDLRGYFLRGLDGTGVVDRQVGRTLKSIQADNFGSHSHTGNTGQGLQSGDVKFTTDEGGDDRTFVVMSGNTQFNSSALAHTHTLNINNTGGLETIPKNVAINYIIRARKIL